MLTLKNRGGGHAYKFGRHLYIRDQEKLCSREETSGLGQKSEETQRAES